jgi:hypothetical protein
MMFKFLNQREQLQNAKFELAKLKSTVGELPPQENAESGEEIKQPQLVDRAEQNRADIDYLAIMGGVDL